MVSGDNRGKFVREVPILCEVSTRRAVVDLEEIALGLQQIEAEAAGVLQHTGVFLRVSRHQPQRSQVVHQTSRIAGIPIQPYGAGGFFRHDGGHQAVNPHLAQHSDPHRGAHHAVHGDGGSHGFDSVRTHDHDGAGQAGDLTRYAEQRRVSQAQQLTREGGVHLDEIAQLAHAGILLLGKGHDALGYGGEGRQRPEGPRRLGSNESFAHNTLRQYYRLNAS